MTPLREIVRVLGDFFKYVLPEVGYKPAPDDSIQSMGLLLEETTAKYRDKTMVISEGRELNWGQFNALTNQFVGCFKAQGLGKGDSVSLLLENRIEMIACMLALSKLGCIVGLINTNLTGKALVHCISVTEAKKLVVGEELQDTIASVKDELQLTQGDDYLWVADITGGQAAGGQAPDWTLDISAQLDSMPTDNPPETHTVTAGSKAVYVFTSGTTGLPKAAVIDHRRALSSFQPVSRVGFHIKSTDRMYICLPLYHSTGLSIGFGSCLASGASFFLRRRFSAKNFWDETRKYNTNLFVYVGELCRYLSLQPPQANDGDNPLERMMGNGLRPDIWEQFKTRFKVGRICELYGSSEGNLLFLNIFNKDNTIGTAFMPRKLLQYDVDEDEIVRDAKGHYIEVKKGEPGLLVGEISDKYRFEGYTNKEASEKKILHDVIKKGDAWFNTGDLVKQVDVGFAMFFPHYQFVDRVGDTFRWRSENVSTNEVGEALNANAQVEISNVFGVEVPGAEGKAGMVALTLKEGVSFDPVEFSQYVKQHLPSFAQPVFLRIQPMLETTVTFKLVKGELRKQAFHKDQYDDPVYVLKPGAKQYERLDDEFYAALQAGKGGY